MSSMVYKRDETFGNTTMHAKKRVIYKSEGERLTNPHVITWCGKELPLRDKDTYVPFDKKEHAEQVCHECKEAISSYYRRKQRQTGNS